MTFETWLNTTPTPALKEQGKVAENALYAIAKIAWEAGFMQGYREGKEAHRLTAPAASPAAGH